MKCICHWQEEQPVPVSQALYAPVGKKTLEVTGKISKINVGSGNQVTYKGWPMYYYGPDADATGMFRGNNKGVSVPKPNVWPVFLMDFPSAPKK
jgi:hypothetical protein